MNTNKSNPIYNIYIQLFQKILQQKPTSLTLKIVSNYHLIPQL